MVRCPPMFRSPRARGAYLCAAALTVTIAAVPAGARMRVTPPLALGAPMEPPRGFVEMCRDDPGPLCPDPAPIAIAPVTVPPVLAEPFPAPETGYRLTLAALVAPVSFAPRLPAPFAAPVAPPVTPAEVEAAPEAAPEPAAEPADPHAHFALLRSINRLVNDNVLQLSDRVTANSDEHWQRSGVGPQAAGDCEDLAIEKRLRLIEAGFPADRLRFAVVYSRAAGLHTLLVARTDDRGDVVLDSRQDRIVPWHKARYRWLSVQSTGDPMAWYSAMTA